MENLPEKKPEPIAKVLAPEDISSIPPEILKELHIIPKSEHQSVQSEDEIPAEILEKVRAIAGENIFGEEPGGFSWAALVYGPFYYAAMKDWLFAGLSAVASLLIYTIPLLIPLAFFARKRAWHHKTWEGEEKFWQIQRQWDKSAIIGGVLSIIVLYFLSQYVFTTLSSTFGTNDPNTILQQVQNQYQP